MDRYLIGLTAALIQLGVRVTWLSRRSEPVHPRHSASLPVSVIELDDRSVIYWEQVALPFHFSESSYDIYHAPAERGIPFVSPIPTVMTVHSLTVPSYRHLLDTGKLDGELANYLDLPHPTFRVRWTAAYYARQLHAAAHVFTPSNFAANELISLGGLPKHRVSVTPLAVDAAFQRARRSAKDVAPVLRSLGIGARPYVLYVGGYERHKNVEGLLRAFALVRKRMPEIMLVLVGTGVPPDRIRRSVHELGVAEHVCILSDVSNELVDLYDGARAFVSMSWRETFCLPALEALSRGIPPITSSWGASTEVLGDCGDVIDPNDCGAFADRIVERIMVPPTSPIALERRAAEFSWFRCARATLKGYAEVLGA